MNRLSIKTKKKKEVERERARAVDRECVFVFDQNCFEIMLSSQKKHFIRCPRLSSRVAKFNINSD